MIEEEKIQSKIDMIERNLRELNKLDLEKLNEFWDQQAVKYTLMELIEASIDIANHIIAAKGFKRAEKYREYFQVLKSEGILEENLANRLSKMAGFRNILVHRYGEVEIGRLRKFLQKNLKDFEKFLKAINQWLERERN